MKRILCIVLILMLCMFPIPSNAESTSAAFFCCRFDGKSTFFRSSESDIEYTDDETMHFISGDTSVFADTECSAAANVDSIVLDTKIKIDKAEGNGSIVLFESKEDRSTAAPNWRTGVKIGDSGVMALNSGTYNCKIGEWFRYSAVYNIKKGTCSVYVDGMLLDTFSKQNGTLYHTLFRISREVKNGASADFDFSIDDLAIYPGNNPLSAADYESLDETDSIFTDETEAAFYLGNSEAYSVSGNYCFKTGKRTAYPAGIEKPFIKAGKVYVTESFASEVMGRDVNTAESIGYNGKTYYEPVAKNIYVYERGGGFFAVSDNEIFLKDSEHFLKMNDSADIVYRYLQFDNPSAEDVLNDFEKNVSAHPRVFFDIDDINYINKKIETGDALWKKAYNKDISYADDVISRYPVTASCSDSNKQTEASNLYKTLKNCIVAYRITGNTKYSDKAIEKILTICEWKSAGNGTSNLTAGYLAMSFAMCYDAFYDLLTEDQCSIIKDGARKLILNDMVLAYKGAGGPGKMKWMKMNDNFVGFISGGAAAFCAAFWDEGDMKEDISFLLPNVIKSMEIAVSLYGPEGGFYEGAPYSEFMLEMLTQGVEGLIRCCGTDYGLGNEEGFSEAGSMFVYLTGSENQMNFHDTDSYFDRNGSFISPRVQYTYLPFWFAMRYGKMLYSELNYRKYELHPTTVYGGDNTLGIMSMFYYTKAKECSDSADMANAPLDRYFHNAEAGSFRSGFGHKNETFVGFHGGYTGLTHDMLDIGEFVFESDGIPWAIDIGKDNYNLPKYFERTDPSGNNITGYRYYRKRPEGENCVVINPSVDPTGYDGQTVNAFAGLMFFRSDESAAMAAYDMSDVYSRDVKKYTRGYYFGDNRQTLLIQDEIELKDLSEIYWFMHTGTDIEITDSNTATLTKDGKSLRAEIYCNGGEFKLSAEEATPLKSSPVPPAAQSANNGVKKLTLHMQNASGKVVIAVKLIPGSAKETDGFKVRDISKWDLPSDEYDFTVKETSFSYDNKLNISAVVPHFTNKIQAYCDGKRISEFVPLETGDTSFCIDIPDLPAGEHEIYFIAETQKGTETAKSRFVKNGTVFYEDKITDYDGIEKQVCDGWFFTADSRNILLGVKRVSDYRKKYLSAGIFECSFDVTMPESNTTLSVSALNSGGKEYPSDCVISNNGIFANGESVVAGKKYHIRITTDFGLGEQRIYLNDGEEKLLYEFTKKTLIHSLVKLTVSADRDVIWQNAVYKFYPNDFKCLTLREDNGIISANINEADCVIIYAAYSSEGDLLKVKKTVSGAGFEPPENTSYVKTMAFSDFESLAPICTSAYCTVERGK